MRIGIVNNNNYTHTVCRVTGQKINIPAKKFVIIDTDNEQEINYWTNLRKDIAEKVGIKVFTNEKDIISLEVGRHTTNRMVYADISIVGDSVSPVAKEIAEQATKKQEPEKHIYTEEELLQKSKEDLIDICNDSNIKYRKNSSVKALVKLILESDGQ